MTTLTKKSKHNKILASIIVLISLGLIVFFSTVVDSLTKFAYNYMDPNPDADPYIYIFIIKVTLILVIVLCLIVGIGLFFNWHLKLIDFIKSIIDTDKLQMVLFVDKLTSIKKYTIGVFIFTTFYAILLHLIYLIFGNIYDKGAGSLDENLAEYISSFLLIISSIILFISILFLKNINISKKSKRIIKVWLTTLSLMFLLVFMEEISWGQQIFQWETKGALNDINFQRETNLHNVIQPLLKFLYPLGGIGLFFVLLVLWFFPKDKNPYWIDLITPHISLIYLAFFMACISFDGLLLSELFELLFYPFILFYSIRIFLCLKYPSSINNNGEQIQEN